MKRFKILELVVFITLTGTSVSSPTPCDDNWTAFQGSCYLFGHNKHNFMDANRFCEHYHAHLVRIDDAIENTFIQSVMVRLKDANFWIGLNDLVTEGIWQWYDTDNVATFSDWNPGEPNQQMAANCVAMREGYKYNWVDDPCDNQYFALCEKTPRNENEIVG